MCRCRSSRGSSSRSIAHSAYSPREGAKDWEPILEPHAGASLGNILTEARAGLRVRAGFNLQHPWQPVPLRETPEISFFADATGRGILRNEFLAGTMFRPSPHVEERPFVAEYQLGVLVRYERLTIRYSMDQIGSEYLSRPNGHAWSRIGIEWRVGR